MLSLVSPSTSVHLAPAIRFFTSSCQCKRQLAQSRLHSRRLLANKRCFLCPIFSVVSSLSAVYILCASYCIFLCSRRCCHTVIVPFSLSFDTLSERILIALKKVERGGTIFSQLDLNKLLNFLYRNFLYWILIIMDIEDMISKIIEDHGYRISNRYIPLYI